MAETELQPPQPQKVEIPPVIEEQTQGGKQYRAYQKQNPDATTWESHVGGLIGSLFSISLLTAATFATGGLAGAVGLAGGLATAFSWVAPIAISMGLAYSGSWIGQKFGKARVEKENAEGKVYNQPSRLNHEAIEQGFSGAFIWKALTAIGLGIGLWAIGHVPNGGLVTLGSGEGASAVPTMIAGAFSLSSVVLTGSVLAAAYGGLKGIFSGSSMGKARMEREYHDAELINALQTGKGVPVRSMATGIDSPTVGKVAGIAAGVTSAVDPSTVIHHIPTLGEKANDAGMPGKVGGNRQYRDFSDVPDHPFNRKKINFAQRELDKSMAQEQTQPAR